MPHTYRVEDFAQAIRAIGEPIHSRPADQISMAKLLTLLFEVTALFEMTTRLELVMLQKTMVVVEGVARKLDPQLNMWATAEPVVGDWIADNLGPRGRIEDVGRGLSLLVKLIGEAPARLERLARWIDAGGLEKDARRLRRTLALPSAASSSLLDRCHQSWRVSPRTWPCTRSIFCTVDAVLLECLQPTIAERLKLVAIARAMESVGRFQIRMHRERPGLSLLTKICTPRYRYSCRLRTFTAPIRYSGESQCVRVGLAFHEFARHFGFPDPADHRRRHRGL